MEFSLSGIGTIADAAILLFFYYRLRRSKDTDNRFFQYFEGFAILMSVSLILLSFPNFFFPNDSFILGLGYVIGHMFGGFSCAYVARIWLLISKPSFDSSIVFKIYLVLGLAATALSVYLFNYPTVNENGIVLWNVQQPVGIALVLIVVSTIVPAAIVFIIQAVKQPKMRTRYALIGTSFFLMIVGGPMHDMATTTEIYLLADFVTTLAFLVMFFGVVTNSQSNKVAEK